MDYFLQVFGGITVGKVVVVIGALAFLAAVYKNIAKYISDKVIADKEKDDRIQKVIDQAEKYPQWHQQSVEYQKQYANNFRELKEQIEAQQKKLEKIEEDKRARDRNGMQDRLLQSYRYYTSKKHNPLQAWSEMEATAFWAIFTDYEDAGGNGYMHSEVQPAMKLLEKIPMHEKERIAELMNSRR